MVKPLRLLHSSLVLVQFFQGDEAVIVLVNRLKLLHQFIVVGLVALIPHQEADNAGLEVGGALKFFEVFADHHHRLTGP